MFPNPMRLYRRGLVLIVMAAVLVLGLAALASAQTPRLVGTTVVVSQDTRSKIQLSTNFGTMKTSGRYLFTTEIHDVNGAKVAEWTNAAFVRRGRNISRSYFWDATNASDGRYTFSTEIYKPNRTGLIGSNGSAGSMTLGTSGWTASAIANSSVGNADPIALDGRFVAPQTANGKYGLEMTVSNGSRQVADYTENSTIKGAQTIDFVRDLAQPGAGSYTVAMKVSINGTVLFINDNAGAFTVNTAPVTTTTTAPSPTTTTIQPTTTTTEPPLTSTTTVVNTPVTTKSGTTTATGATTDDGLTDLPGWKLEFNENFNQNVAEGGFLSTYTDFDAYPYPWTDTSGNGKYQPNILSVSNSNLVMDIHTDSSGNHLVAAPEPKVNNGSTNQLYGRYSVRFKADQIVGYKTAWLLWPESDEWNDGEIDFPEGNLNGSIEAFMHYVGNPTSQDEFPTGTNYGQWHVATTEWSPGRVNFYMDGKLIGTSTNHVPTKAMHWVLQTETSLDGVTPADNVKGNVYVDWAAAWAYSPSTK